MPEYLIHCSSVAIWQHKRKELVALRGFMNVNKWQWFRYKSEVLIHHQDCLVVCIMATVQDNHQLLRSVVSNILWDEVYSSYNMCRATKNFHIQNLQMAK
jgi:hypothetical protein